MDEALPCLNSYFTDEPPHIRPFIFQPRYHHGLDPAYHPALVQNSRPPARRPPHPAPRPHRPSSNYFSTTSGGVDQEMLWSSVAIFGNGVIDDDADYFGLGLLGEFL